MRQIERRPSAPATRRPQAVRLRSGSAAPLFSSLRSAVTLAGTTDGKISSPAHRAFRPAWCWRCCSRMPASPSSLALNSMSGARSRLREASTMRMASSGAACGDSAGHTPNAFNKSTELASSAAVLVSRDGALASGGGGPIRTTLAPTWASASAAAMPAGPAPTTATSQDVAIDHRSRSTVACICSRLRQADYVAVGPQRKGLLDRRRNKERHDLGSPVLTRQKDGMEP